MRVLFLTKYGRNGASSRLRTLQYLPYLRSQGVTCRVSPLFDDVQLKRRYRKQGHSLVTLIASYTRRLQALLTRGGFDVIWIEKEALPMMPAWLEKALLGSVPYVLDFDDALFHHYDLHRSPLIRRTLGRRLDQLMAHSAAVACGNAYLAERAQQAQARHVVTVPTVVDLRRYPIKPASPVPVRARIVWIGSPSTTPYLKLVAPALQALSRTATFTLRLIGASKIDLPGINVEHVPWDEFTEAKAIAECDIGIMPLADGPWERGKCGYKLIQYMACGLPVVASPVGANVDIVANGAAGYLAATTDEWESVLGGLLSDDALRTTLGAEGRRRVESHYSLAVTRARIHELLISAAGDRPRIRSQK